MPRWLIAAGVGMWLLCGGVAGAAAQERVLGGEVTAPADTAWLTGPVEVVQNPASSVPLVGGRAAWARVHMRTNHAGYLRGRLQMERPGLADTVLLSWGPAALYPDGASGAATRRENWKRSLNFLIPADVARLSAVTARVEALFHDAQGTPVVCAGCTEAAQPVAFGPPAVLRVKVVGLRYWMDGVSVVPRRGFRPAAVVAQPRVPGQQGVDGAGERGRTYAASSGVRRRERAAGEAARPRPQGRPGPQHALLRADVR